METVLVLLRKFLRGSLLILGWGLLVGAGLCATGMFWQLRLSEFAVFVLLPSALIGLLGWGLLALANQLRQDDSPPPAPIAPADTPEP